MSTATDSVKSENQINDLFQQTRDLEYDLHVLLNQYKPVKKRVKTLQNRYRIELGTTKDRIKKDEMYVIIYSYFFFICFQYSIDIIYIYICIYLIIFILTFPFFFSKVVMI